MPSNTSKLTSASILIAALTLLVYYPVLHNGFINYDDNQYVTANTMVQTGLSVKGLAWAFSSILTGNWHPLTWLSHMLDVEMFGLNPAGHHFTSLALHTVNALLIFILLAKQTGYIARSLFVALLFSLHPLHVESVAWIAERKDVLSTFFLLLTIAAYLRYNRRPVISRYLTVVIFFSFGLMSKQMLVTLPLLLLLLDYWLATTHSGNADHIPPDRGMRMLLVEKIPLVAISLAMSILVLYTQNAAGALREMSSISLPVNLGNAIVVYVTYLGQMLWPENLAVIYPFDPDRVTAFNVTASGCLLMLITLTTIRQRNRRPYLAFGWFWYLITLLPVIGVLRIGMHAHADRYTYIPLIGIFIMLVWGCAEPVAKVKHGKSAAAAVAVSILIILAMLSRLQLRHWENSITIFTHTLAVTEKNWIAHTNLGMAYVKTQNSDNAFWHLEEAIRINPEYPVAIENLGKLYFTIGNTTDAIPLLQKAVMITNNPAEAHLYLGYAYVEIGALDLAQEEYFQLRSLDENLAEALAFGISRGVSVDIKK